MIYDLFIEPLQYQFVQRALIASVMVGIINGALGCFIILRRMAFIGDALSHAVLPGVVIAFMVAGKGHFALFLGAVFAGIVTALLIGFVNRNSRIKEDSAIGVIFIGMFALGILLISRLQAVHLDLQHFLFGDPLGVSPGDLYLTGVIGIVILGSIILFYKQLQLTSFDPTMATAIGMNTGLVHYFLMGILSMTIVASLQAVGIILVVAMLITPGATAYLLTERLPRMLILASLIGAVAAISGLYISYWMNYSSGAAMVIVVTFIFLTTLVFAPKQGILIKSLQRKRARERHLSDDILKGIYHYSRDKKDALIQNVADYLGIPVPSLRKAAVRLKQKNLIETADRDLLNLTSEGEKQALKLLRSHRLWETYLTEKAGLGWEQVDGEAEHMEHYLSDDILDEIDERLGYPEHDPHGAPIPKKDGTIRETEDRPLATLHVGESGVITRVSDQIPEVLATLWKAGLVPNVQITVTERDNGTMQVQVGTKKFKLDDKSTTRVMVKKV
jgi:ABC-type Mn2+/Zn2+ transport system permease subunit/Mn-dependent DtxR family transcriptional regulator